MKKVLITGVTGFAGSHLAEILFTKGDYELFGTSLSASAIDAISSIKDKIRLFELDLLNQEAVEKIFFDNTFEYVFHLAALTSPAESFSNPARILTNNILSQISLLEALRKTKSKARIIIVSSAEVYGKIELEDLPIDENTEFRPLNPYAVSKLTQDFLGLQYCLSSGLDIVRVRPFNHIGPRQGEQFVVSSFSKQIAEIEKGKKEPILKVGNLEAKRDFTDVRDIVRAYVLVAEKAKRGDVYNVGSGRSFKIKEVLDKLLSFSTSKISVEVDEALFRPVDAPNVVCDATKLKKLTGWEVSIPLDTSLKDTLDYWRQIL